MGKSMSDVYIVYKMFVLKEALTIIVTLSAQLQIKNLGLLKPKKYYSLANITLVKYKK